MSKKLTQLPNVRTTVSPRDQLPWEMGRYSAADLSERESYVSLFDDHLLTETGYVLCTEDSERILLDG